MSAPVRASTSQAEPGAEDEGQGRAFHGKDRSAGAEFFLVGGSAGRAPFAPEARSRSRYAALR